jgi:hypothetical protein
MVAWTLHYHALSGPMVLHAAGADKPCFQQSRIASSFPSIWLVDEPCALPCTAHDDGYAVALPRLERGI